MTTDTVRYLDAAQLALRDAEGDGPRKVGGYGVRWGSVAERTAEYGPEAFAPGSFRAALRALGGRPIPMLDRHDGNVIGTLTATEDAQGLLLDGTLLGNDHARAWAERSAAGVDGASIEYLPDPAGFAVTRDGVTVHKRVARLVAVAASYKPAHLGAAISLRDLEDSMALDTITFPETPAPPEPEPEPKPDPEPVTMTAVQGVVHREVAALKRSMAELGEVRGADPWAAVRDMGLGELARGVMDGRTELRGVLARALADQTTAESPGVTTPGVLQDVKRLFIRSRPGIDAFGRVPLDGVGMSVEWPIFSTALGTIVGEQLTQKAEVTSVDVPLTKGSVAIRTFAGGSDVAYQLIRRSSPAYLAALERAYLSAYAAVTDGAFVDAIEGTAGLASIVINWVTATPAQMQEAVFLASTMIQDATGQPAEFVLAGAGTFTEIGGALTPPPVFNQAGSAQASTLAPNLSGLRVIYQPNVNAGTAIISNSEAAKWHEDGPEFVQEEDVAKLGRNVAVWGMGAAAVYVPAGIVKTAAA